MSETELLSEQLFQNPDDFTLAGALRDHLFGDVGMVYAEAERKVDEVITLGRYARDLATVAEMVKPGAADRPHILGAICDSAGVPYGARVVVFLVPGEQRASLVVAPARVKRRLRQVHNVTIGATRVLRAARCSSIRGGAPRDGGEFLFA